MGGGEPTERKSTASHGLPLLHTRALMRRTPANRVFAVVYLCVILALLYHHFIALLHSASIVSFLILLADAVLAFMWVTTLAFRMCPTERQIFIEHLEHYAKESNYPGLDVFICTADPYKEPPIDVVNTALSVMAYDYPTEKLSVYVSDDGGSQLTLFAFMEAARFASHWLPYCKKNKIVERCPKAYFASNPSWFPETDQIKVKFQNSTLGALIIFFFFLFSFICPLRIYTSLLVLFGLSHEGPFAENFATSIKGFSLVARDKRRSPLLLPFLFPFFFPFFLVYGVHYPRSIGQQQ